MDYITNITRLTMNIKHSMKHKHPYSTVTQLLKKLLHSGESVDPLLPSQQSIIGPSLEPNDSNSHLQIAPLRIHVNMWLNN